MKKQVKNWILFADQDLKTAEIVIKDEYPLTNIIAFHCQQAIEKYMKAFLVEKNFPIIRTHDLIKLNDMIRSIRDLGIDEKKMILLNEVYTETRYPSDLGLLPDGLPSGKQANDFLEYAKEVKAIVSYELTKKTEGAIR